jgi:hypothetical protein
MAATPFRPPPPLGRGRGQGDEATILTHGLGRGLHSPAALRLRWQGNNLSLSYARPRHQPPPLIPLLIGEATKEQCAARWNTRNTGERVLRYA